MSTLMLGRPDYPLPVPSRSVDLYTVSQDLEGCCAEIAQDDVYLFIVYEYVPDFFPTLARYRRPDAATRVVICDCAMDANDLNGLRTCFPRPPAVVSDLCAYLLNDLEIVNYGYLCADDVEIFCLCYARFDVKS